MEYNPEKAKALLKEAGYPNGFDTMITADPPVRLGTEAVAVSLKKVGIRCKVNIPEHGIWVREIKQRKFRGLGSHPGPWWVSRTHPAVAFDSHLSAASPWSYFTTPEVDAELKKLARMTDQKEVAAQAAKISTMYREEQMVRAPLWAWHIPYGLGPKVKYWENVAGWVFPACFEFLTLKD